MRLEPWRQCTASRCASGDFMPMSSRCCSSAAARAARTSSTVGIGLRLSGRSSTGTPPSIETQYRPRAASYAVAVPYILLRSGRPVSPSTRTRRPTSAPAAVLPAPAAAPPALPAPPVPAVEEEAAAAEEEKAVAGVKAACWSSVA